MLPLGLTMSWEPTDSVEALRARFGFDGLAAAAAWISSTLTERWGIRVVSCTRLVISAQNALAWVDTPGDSLVIKWSNAGAFFDGLEASAELVGWLAERGACVARPQPTIAGEHRVTVQGPLGPVSVAVVGEAIGSWLDVEDLSAVREAGACLARLHHSLRTYADPRLWRPEAFVPPEERIGAWLNGSDAGFAPDGSRRLARMVAESPPLDGQAQPVHNDYRAANILTRDGHVAAVLDFDDASWDHPVADLAKASVYLATRFTDWRPTPQTVREQLRQGYEAVSPLTALQARWLDTLTLWHALMAIPGRDDPVGWAQTL